MPAPFLAYGLYLVAAATARTAAQYAIRKLGGKAAGKLISKHSTRDLANKAKDVLSRSGAKHPKGAPGVTFGGGTKRSAIIGQQAVKRYTLGRRGEGVAVGAAATAAAVGADKLIDAIKDAKKEDAPTSSLKKQFIKAVKSKTDDPKKIAQARQDFDSFVGGKKRSLNFNYGGMVRKTKRKK